MSSFKAVGIRYFRGDGTGTQHAKRITTTGQELEAEQWMPEVEEGIIYADGALDLTGDKVIAIKAKTPKEQLLDDIAKGFIVTDVKKLSIGMKSLVGKSPIKKKKKWAKKF